MCEKFRRMLAWHRHHDDIAMTTGLTAACELRKRLCVASKLAY